MKIKKDDLVKVLYGNDSGKTGKVLKVIPSTKEIVVEGLNMYKKSVKGNGKDKESAIIDIIKPMKVSKVMIVCPSCSKATRVGYKIDDGKKLRICKKCGKQVDSVPSVKKSVSKSSDKKQTSKSKKDKK
ncbi:50S ribosomal protein L24 [Candidatus Dojkabacteria bacterium]|nr:50S ribosomal protein L24 [Candidatus Dojkabacteria bacterium]